MADPDAPNWWSHEDLLTRLSLPLLRVDGNGLVHLLMQRPPHATGTGGSVEEAAIELTLSLAQFAKDWPTHISEEANFVIERDLVVALNSSTFEDLAGWVTSNVPPLHQAALDRAGDNEASRAEGCDPS
jgi:hypothetical protein